MTDTTTEPRPTPPTPPEREEIETVWHDEELDVADDDAPHPHVPLPKRKKIAKRPVPRQRFVDED